MSQNYLTLNNGRKIPAIGLGTWASPQNLVGQAVVYAITTAGYRHIDCASVYGNEKEIGVALSDVLSSPKIARSDLFLTSKLWNTYHDPKLVEKACRQSLADLQLEYLDLYLMHWGIAFCPGANIEPLGKDGKIITQNIPLQDTWKAMEHLVKKGLVKSIGVANFSAPMLVDLLSYAKILPVMNQIELHPYNSQNDLVSFCQYKNIAVTAYSPLGTPGGREADEPILLQDKVIVNIAKLHHKSPAQILLNWAFSRGTIPIPKSTNPSRIRENIAVFDFKLSKEDMRQISILNRNYRFVNPVKWWGIPYFS